MLCRAVPRCAMPQVRDDLLEAYRLAVRADPISAFGGIVAFNRWAGQRGLWGGFFHRAEWEQKRGQINSCV